MAKQRMAITDTSLYGRQGVTLIELMIAMVLSSFAIAAIVMAFRSQESSSLVQEAVTVMQQNNAAAMDIMTKELRMAGYDPTESKTSPPATGYATTDAIPAATPSTIAMITASSATLRFTADLNGDGDVDDPSTALSPAIPDPNEDVTYGFSAANDANGDGIADSGAADLGRKTGNGAGSNMLPMAENIQAINFAYAYDANGDGILDQYTLAAGPYAGQQRTIWAFHSGGIWYDLDTNSDGVIDALDDTNGDGAIEGRNTTTPSSVNDVRAIRIWILARSNRADSKITDTNTYVVGRRVLTPNDRYFRRILSTTVTCRNMGI